MAMVGSEFWRSEVRANASRFAGIGFAFVALIGLFTLGGYVLGSILGGMAAFVLLGLFVGFAAALAYLYIRLKELGRE